MKYVKKRFFLWTWCPTKRFTYWAPRRLMFVCAVVDTVNSIVCFNVKIIGISWFSPSCPFPNTNTTKFHMFLFSCLSWCARYPLETNLLFENTILQEHTMCPAFALVFTTTTTLGQNKPNADPRVIVPSKRALKARYWLKRDIGFIVCSTNEPLTSGHVVVIGGRVLLISICMPPSFFSSP